MMLAQRPQCIFRELAASLLLHVVWSVPSIVVILGMLSPAFAAEGASDSENAPTKEETRARQMASSRDQAERTVVRRLAAGANETEPLNPQTLFRYDDEPRKILDGVVWSWPAEGRPVVVRKIELYDRPEGRPKWFFCTASLSEDLVETTSAGGILWASAKPGVKMRPLPDAPDAVKSAIGRLVQMKNLARRFSSKMVDPPINVEQEMRFLARPLHRYSDPDSGIIDGTIFGFATNGTNPDLLLLIELAGKDGSSGTWRYAVARMTIAELHVRLDEKEVWSVPYITPPGPGRPARFDTWAFSWEPMK